MIDGSRGRTRGVVDVAASWERFRNLNGEESESEVNVEFDRSSEDLDVDDRDAAMQLLCFDSVRIGPELGS
ncbi:hypothetical protein AXG93_517s1060 [Marchantia polymorpha subsp. ruderalis]|uniref:Uncharacterized protein n=1 Tax=Marchantia polymorpha subsp. ruderalis TaxID=1480154 RepID=A0A176VJK1_MARPO|nr:hypothetical protein AXG93_517s1060 [Marchantia polymorpha subsp. ruderalis]